METRLFLSFTATDAWLTASEINALLQQRGYWSVAQTHLPRNQRLSYVIRQLETLTDAASSPLFERVTSLGPAGQPVVRYKQSRLIRPPGNVRDPDSPTP